jgi:hypothetical protein
MLLSGLLARPETTCTPSGLKTSWRKMCLGALISYSYNISASKHMFRPIDNLKQDNSNRPKMTTQSGILTNTLMAQYSNSDKQYNSNK